MLVCGLLAGCGGFTGLPLTAGLPIPDSDTTAAGLYEGYPAKLGEPCIQTGWPRTAIHQELFEELNAYRAEHGLVPLVYSFVLEQAIEIHVADMWQRQFFSHTNPEGETPGDRAMRFGFCHHYVGENLAAGQRNVQQAIQAWKNSPSHNANMLEPGYAYVGIGYFVDPTGRPYWGQTFAYKLP